jgi:hypothetical protein
VVHADPHSCVGRWACAVGDACRSVAEVAGYYGVSWPTAHAAVVLAAQEVLREPEPTEVLGIDETRRGRPRWALSTEAAPLGPYRCVGHRVCRSRR